MVTAAQKKAAAKARRSRNRFKGIRALDALQGIMQANVWISAAFKMDTWNFFTAGTALNPSTKWTGQGEERISFKELLTWPFSATADGQKVTASRLEVIMQNLGGATVIDSVVKSALIGVGFTVAKKALRKPLNQGNKLLKMGGVSDMVRL